jgi:hypothetical protein
MSAASPGLELGVERLHRALAAGTDAAGVLARLFAEGKPGPCAERRWRRVGSQEVHDCPVIALAVEALACELHIQITRNPGDVGSERIGFLDLHPAGADDEAWLAAMTAALRLAFGPSEALAAAERYRKTTEGVQKTLLAANGAPARLLLVRRGPIRGR